MKKEKNIKFESFDWKETERLAFRCVELGNKGYRIQFIDTQSDSYIIAYAKDKLTKREALKAYNNYIY